MTNFYPAQYNKDGLFDIRHNYLQEQFMDSSEIFKLIEQVVRMGDFTLGSSVDQFEVNFANKIGTKYAIGT